MVSYDKYCWMFPFWHRSFAAGCACVVLCTQQFSQKTFQWWILGWLPPWVLDTWVLGYPPLTKQLLGKWANNGAVSQLVKWSLNCCRWKVYPILGLTFSAILKIVILSLWRKLKCKSRKCIPPAAKPVAWVQQWFLHYLFTYTYLFSLNIMSSNLFSAYNEDDKHNAINNWPLTFLAEFVC